MDKPIGKEYTGPSGIARESTWLTNEDLVEGRDLEVQIKAVLHYATVTFEGGRTRANLLGLQFVGKQRVLILNATNRKVLNKMFGNITEAWKGQKVALYVTDTQMKGETVKCVRIRNRGSRAATAAEEFLHDEDDLKATPAPVTREPGEEDESDPFDQACDALGVPLDERAALLTKHGGDRAAAERELSARANEGAA